MYNQFKTILIIVLAFILSIFLYSYVKKEETYNLSLVQRITAEDARVIWTEDMSDGESRHLAYWNKDHCTATIGTYKNEVYFIKNSYCSENKLTK